MIFIMSALGTCFISGSVIFGVYLGFKILQFQPIEEKKDWSHEGIQPTRRQAEYVAYSMIKLPTSQLQGSYFSTKHKVDQSVNELS